ncbi:hypothetical protein [Neoaquamicrobium sediminum]|jgi:hypothetical protein|uniref:Uncharacterized protein n=1 Tax=Neoaquamicrobium sediminum TaxID=1849104 RepID=A0ABV3WY02_9HYPH|nr:hypothetical protein [Mesorhizobium sediminum]MBX9450546.1 hypothetical protein [Mesorhizobium sp.]NRC55449.1 hypothetical protein [Mesorhizobium sediminum]
MARSRKSKRAAGALAGSLMLAPAVAAMRTPLLAMEAQDANPWRVETVRATTEKAAAVIEGAVAAQMSLFWSASNFWMELASGRTPSLLNGVAMERAVHAALKPSGKRVRANYNRLKRG